MLTALPYPVLEGHRAELPEAAVSFVDRAQRLQFHLREGHGARSKTAVPPPRSRTSGFSRLLPAARPSRAGSPQPGGRRPGPPLLSPPGPHWPPWRAAGTTRAPAWGRAAPSPPRMRRRPERAPAAIGAPFPSSSSLPPFADWLRRGGGLSLIGRAEPRERRLVSFAVRLPAGTSFLRRRPAPPPVIVAGAGAAGRPAAAPASSFGRGLRGAG